MYPDTYRYTKEHEWVHVEGDRGTIGITFHAQKELGDIFLSTCPNLARRWSKEKRSDLWSL